MQMSGLIGHERSPNTNDVRLCGEMSPASPSGATHTVVTGECLWSIAAGVLGRDASARAVDRGWRAIYATNRAAIGPDPTLIHPGLVLSLPPLDPNP